MCWFCVERSRVLAAADSEIPVVPPEGPAGSLRVVPGIGRDRTDATGHANLFEERPDGRRWAGVRVDRPGDGSDS